MINQKYSCRLDINARHDPNMFFSLHQLTAQWTDVRLVTMADTDNVITGCGAVKTE